MKKEITLEKLRNIQLDILDKIHSFCIERGIRYSLGGGTLLGAVRHKGYIPWDDDIDIMLPRPDYDRFLKEFEGIYKQYTLQTYMNDESYSFPFAKVYDNRTVLVEDGACNGIYVDVFPIDGLPEKNEIPKFLYKLEILKHNITKTSKYYLFQKGWSLKFRYYIKKILYPKRSESIFKLEELLHSYNFETTNLAGSILGRYGDIEVMDGHVFKSYVKLAFDGRKYYAIADYDLYLTKHYGDYMQLPPKEKQVSNHSFKAWWK